MSNDRLGSGDVDVGFQSKELYYDDTRSRVIVYCKLTLCQVHTIICAIATHGFHRYKVAQANHGQASSRGHYSTNDITTVVRAFN